MSNNKSDERRATRANVMLTAFIECCGVRTPVRLSNLSTQGALVLGENLPAEGTAIIFRRNGLTVKSRVAWVHAHFAGIEFDAPLDPADVLRNVPRLQRRQADPKLFRRPGLHSENITDAQKKIIENWAMAPRSRLGE